MTIELVRDMAADPSSTDKLRAFHRKQLADLLRRQEAQRKPISESPFSRFVDQLAEPEKQQ